MSKNILQSSLENASLNIVFQIFFRLVTFVLNAFVVRHVGVAVLGVMNVRLLLLESTILFLSREPFYKACLTNAAEHNWAQVVNLLWLTVPLCLLMSIVFGYSWLYILPIPETLPDYYNFAVWSVALSCIIHLASLVVQLVSVAFLFTRFKIVVDTLMIVIRTLLFVPMILHRPENALLAFGVAQLASTIFFTLAHYFYFYWYITDLDNKNRQHKKDKIQLDNDANNKSNDTDENLNLNFPFKSVVDFLPGRLNNEASMFDEKLVNLTWSFFRQGFLKQILTEGERMIMTVLPVLTFTQQGIYDVVNNLGSLAARFIFRPIEDSGYFYFTQMVKRDEKIFSQHQSKIKESVEVLTNLCGIVSSIGLIILVFGQSYSSTLLGLYGGDRFTQDFPVLLLRVHCLAVLLLGINGVTECYTNATADSATINKNNRIMICQSIIFLIASYGLVSWLGGVGFILGNCINMALRIYHSISFINERHSETNYKPLRGIIPKPLFAISLVISALVTTISRDYLMPNWIFFHVVIGAIMFGFVIVSWMYGHKELVILGRNKWQERRNQQRNKTD